MAQSVGHHATQQKVAGSIPSQGTYLGSGFGLYERGNQSLFLSHMDVSKPFFLPLSPSP